MFISGSPLFKLTQGPQRPQCAPGPLHFLHGYCRYMRLILLIDWFSCYLCMLCNDDAILLCKNVLDNQFYVFLDS